VVLLDLVVVEGPAVVLVLAVAPPAPPEPDAEMQPVGAEATAGVGWLTYPGDDEPDTVTGEERLELVDVARTERAFGEDDDVDGTLLVPGRLEDPVSQVQVQQLPWCELEEAVRLELGALDGLGRLEVLRVDAQRPRQHQHVPLLYRAARPDGPRRDPVPDGVDLGAPDADVARQ